MRRIKLSILFFIFFTCSAFGHRGSGTSLGHDHKGATAYHTHHYHGPDTDGWQRRNRDLETHGTHGDGTVFYEPHNRDTHEDPDDDVSTPELHSHQVWHSHGGTNHLHRYEHNEINNNHGHDGNVHSETPENGEDSPNDVHNQVIADDTSPAGLQQPHEHDGVRHAHYLREHRRGQYPTTQSEVHGLSQNASEDHRRDGVNNTVTSTSPRPVNYGVTPVVPTIPDVVQDTNANTQNVNAENVVGPQLHGAVANTLGVNTPVVAKGTSVAPIPIEIDNVEKPVSLLSPPPKRKRTQCYLPRSNSNRKVEIESIRYDAEFSAILIKFRNYDTKPVILNRYTIALYNKEGEKIHSTSIGKSRTRYRGRLYIGKRTRKQEYRDTTFVVIQRKHLKSVFPKVKEKHGRVGSAFVMFHQYLFDASWTDKEWTVKISCGSDVVFQYPPEATEENETDDAVANAPMNPYLKTATMWATLKVPR